MEHNYNNGPRFIEDLIDFINLKDKYPENNKNYDSLNIDTVYQFFYKNIDKVEYSKELKNIKK